MVLRRLVRRALLRLSSSDAERPVKVLTHETRADGDRPVVVTV